MIAFLAPIVASLLAIACIVNWVGRLLVGGLAPVNLDGADSR